MYLILSTDFFKANERFATYCPFCQISIASTSLPPGLRDPPAYSPPTSPRISNATPANPPDAGDPPTYASLDNNPGLNEKVLQHDNEVVDDVLHFLNPAQDTILSLALRYAIPPDAIRRKNNLYADHLLAARKAILIPGEYYKGGVSLSPQPIDGEEEEIRKSKIRRWMVTCKVSE
ncbi:MAG: hypothetical protein Q9222_003604 [Ikaeria aurantiellina]